MAALPDVVAKASWGETAFFYNPDNRLKNGTYFATIKEKDGENDSASDLTARGLWRLNIGIQKATFIALFGSPPKRPGKGMTIEGPWDFTARDMIMPHPVYGWMSWVAVIAPSQETWQTCLPLIADAHQRAKATFEKRTSP